MKENGMCSPVFFRHYKKEKQVKRKIVVFSLFNTYPIHKYLAIIINNKVLEFHVTYYEKLNAHDYYVF